MLRLAALLLLGLPVAPLLGAETYPYAPAPPDSGPVNNGSNAVPYDDVRIRGWATGVESFSRGPQDLTYAPLGPATFGAPENALGPANARPSNTMPVVSLGERGSITLSFRDPIVDGPGYDFAVFENGLNDSFLELAFVEVSSNGVDFVGFTTDSRTPTTQQINGDEADPRAFGGLDPKNLYNLAGKYRAGFGTPFDLSDLLASPRIGKLNLRNIRFIRIVDIVGRIDADTTKDSAGHIINDPWSTPYETSGFDLDAIAELNSIPEPRTGALLLGSGFLFLAAARFRPRHAGGFSAYE